MAAPARRHPNAPRAGAAACTWCARWPDVPVTSPRWRGGLLQAAALAREHVGCRRAGARLRAGGRAGARAVWRWPRWPGRGKMVKAGNFTERAPRHAGRQCHWQCSRARGKACSNAHIVLIGRSFRNTFKKISEICEMGFSYYPGSTIFVLDLLGQIMNDA